MNIELVLGFIVATFSLAIMPGPDNLYVLTESISNGAKQGLAITLGLMSGVIVHTTLVATGVSLALVKYEELYVVVKFIGAAYLIKLAYDAWKEPPLNFRSSQESSSQFLSTLALVKKGFLMNVLNPKVTLFFLAFLPQFVSSDGWKPIFQLFFLGFVFILVSFAVFASIALVSGKVATIISSPRFFVITKWIKVSVLVLLAVYLLIAQN